MSVAQWSFRIALSVSIILSSTLSLATDYDGVVVNQYNNVVYSSFGNCVTTKWITGYHVCDQESNELHVFDIPAMPEFVDRMPYDEHMWQHTDNTYQHPVSTTSDMTTIYFDFNQSELSVEAEASLISLHDRLQYNPQLHYRVIGHTDRSGSMPYNMELSKKRAQNVTDKLIFVGADPESIYTHWVGENEPAVHTNDGVPNAKNRRVEVHYHYVD
tara:strand:- start:182 stop:826 length:645 start_codon:yes stop_codon:yes gene_type:complete